MRKNNQITYSSNAVVLRGQSALQGTQGDIWRQFCCRASVCVCTHMCIHVHTRYWHPEIETSDTAKHPMIHTAQPLPQIIILSKTAIVSRLRNFGLML